MSKRDYYEVLGVSRDASEKDVKKAYKRLAMKFHPDRTKGDKDMEEQFKEVKEAYEVLNDSQIRKRLTINMVMRVLISKAVTVVKAISVISLVMYSAISLVVAAVVVVVNVHSAVVICVTTWNLRWKKRFAALAKRSVFQVSVTVKYVTVLVPNLVARQQAVALVMVKAKCKCVKVSLP